LVGGWKSCCGGLDFGVTLNIEAFERAVSTISKLGKRGGAQLNVPPGRWLTAPFNLTSHMTLFLAEDAEILGIQVKCFFFFLKIISVLDLG
jgi:polygalacturonase